MTMKGQSNGFTLIELMIVVAIIGILAAIALPAYQDYTKRAHVSEGLTLGSSAKTGIAEYYESQGMFPNNNSLAGLPPSNEIVGNAVKSINVESTGRVTITYNEKVELDSTIILSPSTDGGGLKFTCNQGNLELKYRPASCR